MSKLSVHDDRGHGGKDSGAVFKGVMEKAINLDIGKRMKEGLLFQGIKVVSTRVDDTTVDPTPRANFVKKSNCEICISNHVNSHLHNKGYGWEILVSKYSNKKLANLILAEFKKIGVDVSRGVKTRLSSNGSDYYYMHRNTGSVETLIVEHGFITNDKDREYLMNPDNRQKLADCIVKAICLYKGITYKHSKPLPPINTGNTGQSKGQFFRVVTGSFENRENADKRIEDLKKVGYDSFIIIENK